MISVMTETNDTEYNAFLRGGDFAAGQRSTSDAESIIDIGSFGDVDKGFKSFWEEGIFDD